MKGTLKVTKRLEAKVGLRAHALHGEGRPQTFALGWTTRRDGELRFFFFFLVVVSGTSPERSLLAHVSEQSAGRSGLRDQLVPAILSARPALPGPARPSGSSSGSQTRSAARHRPLRLRELSPAGPSALFILICSA